MKNTYLKNTVVPLATCRLWRRHIASFLEYYYFYWFKLIYLGGKSLSTTSSIIHFESSLTLREPLELADPKKPYSAGLRSHSEKTARCSNILLSTVGLGTMKLVYGRGGVIPSEMISPLFRSLHHWGPTSFVLFFHSLYFLLCFSFDWKSKYVYPPTNTHRHTHTQTSVRKEEIEKVNSAVPLEDGMSEVCLAHCPASEARNRAGFTASAPRQWGPWRGPGLTKYNKRLGSDRKVQRGHLTRLSYLTFGSGCQKAIPCDWIWSEDGDRKLEFCQRCQVKLI